ncbi:MAG: hypothetical protein ACP5RJ_08995, partial [Conexivisphaera sp.]
ARQANNISSQAQQNQQYFQNLLNEFAANNYQGCVVICGNQWIYSSDCNPSYVCQTMPVNGTMSYDQVLNYQIKIGYSAPNSSLVGLSAPWPVSNLTGEIDSNMVSKSYTGVWSDVVARMEEDESAIKSFVG